MHRGSFLGTWQSGLGNEQVHFGPCSQQLAQGNHLQVPWLLQACSLHALADGIQAEQGAIHLQACTKHLTDGKTVLVRIF